MAHSSPSEVRSPAVAGRFYPGDAAALDRSVRALLGPLPRSDGVDARLVMVPHAGYQYSGAIAGETYARVRPRSRAIVLCPNHTGLGSRRSVSPARAWSIPGGELCTDEELREQVCKQAGLELDALAHLREHAIEVQLPFLRAMSKQTTFVAICLAQLSLDECQRIGKDIAEAVRALHAERDVLFVASTDMSHYVPADFAAQEDGLALERVRDLDAAGLYRVVRQRHISMCGYIPTTVALFAARALGATATEIVRYGNSGETTGDYASVVGYAGAFSV